MSRAYASSAAGLFSKQCMHSSIHIFTDSHICHRQYYDSPLNNNRQDQGRADIYTTKTKAAAKFNYRRCQHCETGMTTSPSLYRVDDDTLVYEYYSTFTNGNEWQQRRLQGRDGPLKMSKLGNPRHLRMYYALTGQGRGWTMLEFKSLVQVALLCWPPPFFFKRKHGTWGG